MEKSDFLNAELEFDKAAALTPSVAMPQVALAMSALRQGDIYKAEARAIKATRVAPDDASAWNVTGDVRHMQGELEAAVKAYDTALDRAPKHYDARLSRAGVLLDLGRFEESEQDVKALREARPLDPRPVYLESVLLAKRKRNTEAREALRRAAALLDEMGAVALARSMQLVLLAGLANFDGRPGAGAGASVAIRRAVPGTARTAQAARCGVASQRPSHRGHLGAGTGPAEGAE